MENGKSIYFIFFRELVCFFRIGFIFGYGIFYFYIFVSDDLRRILFFGINGFKFMDDYFFFAYWVIVSNFLFMLNIKGY